MKKLRLVVLISFVLISFFACQKSQDVPATVVESTQEEIMSCRGGGTVPPPMECGVFRTQSQGGWGITPAGNNAGRYLHNHFADAFPSGLSIGCDGTGYSVHFNSAAAITQFLPAGGTPSVLSSNATDPRYWTLRNTLAGQVTALALNVGFDFFDADFSPAEEKLGNLQILSGPFSGRSVSEFLVISQGVLGGCNSDFSPEAINQTASVINGNFLDGRSNNGFLGCPASRLER